MHFDIEQDGMLPVVRLDRKATRRPRQERHDLRLARLDRCLDIVPVQMQHRTTIGRPGDFDRVVAPDSDGLQVAGKAAVLNPQVEIHPPLKVANTTDVGTFVGTRMSTFGGLLNAMLAPQQLI